MSVQAARPIGLTIVAVVIILHGIWAIVAGLNLVRAIDIVALPATGDPTATGWAMIVVGILDIVVGVGRFTLKTPRARGRRGDRDGRPAVIARAGAVRALMLGRQIGCRRAASSSF